MGRIPDADRKGLQFIRGHYLSTGSTPSLRGIAMELGYRSPRSAQQLVERLRDAGLIEYENGRITLTPDSLEEAAEQTVAIPLLGHVPCGGPWFGEQHIESYVDVSIRIAPPEGEYFLLKAHGDSMDLSGIRNGDLVLVKRQAAARPGDRVVGLVNHEVTVKHFHLEDGFVILKPNSTNPAHRPIVLTEDFIIQGVVLRTIPNVF